MLVSCLCKLDARVLHKYSKVETSKHVPCELPHIE
jgi:hypothetical protein